MAFGIGAGCLYYCHASVGESRRGLAAQFGITPPGKVAKGGGKFLRRLWTSMTRPSCEEGDYVLTFAEALERHGGLREKFGLPPGGGPSEDADKARKVDPNEKFVVVEPLWWDVCRRSTPLGRNLRTAATGILFFLGCFCLVGATHFPVIPFRGSFSHNWDLLVLLPASLMMIYLMFWVVDETHICLRFIEKIGRPELTMWPKHAYRDIPSLEPEVCDRGVLDNAASSYIDVCFIGKLSKEAVPLIIMPFVVLTLMIVARWNYFANWRWDPVVLSVFGIDSAICVCCAIMLRNKAVAAKGRALRQISRAIAEARAADLAPRAEGLEKLRDLMEANMDGAFVPWHQQPFVSALLIPFGGTGGMALVEYFLSRP